MNSNIIKYKKFILIPAVIWSAPLVLETLVWVALFIFSRVQSTFLVTILQILHLVPFYWLIEAGKSIFFVYLFITPVLIVLSLGVILYCERKKFFRYFLFYYFLIGLIAICLYIKPFLAEQGIYYPARSAQVGVKHHIIGLPHNWFDNYFKFHCIYAECKAERYEVLGWENQNVLLYKKWDSWTYGDKRGEYIPLSQEQKLQFDTQTGKSTPYHGQTSTLSKQTCQAKDCLKDLMKDASNPMYECTTVYISPNQDKFACIAKHMYGPQDILIFEK